MTEKETTSGGAVWRKRAIASVSVAAAVCALGVGFASSASAATPPTLTVTAPTTIVNDNTMASTPLKIRVNNVGTGAGVPVNAGGSDVLRVTITPPAGLACANITLSPENTGPTSQAVATSPTLVLNPAASTGGSCVFDAAAGAANQPANSDTTYNYGVQINGSGTAGPPPVVGITGTVSTQASLREALGGNTLSVATSNTATSNLISPANNTAAVFSTTAPPAGTIYNPYSYTEATSVGTPNAGSDFTAFVTDARPDATTGVYNDAFTRSAGALLYSSSTDTTSEPGISLNDSNSNTNDGFYFDTATGTIVWYDNVSGKLIPGSPDFTESLPDYSFYIVANNGTGGYTPAAGAPATIPGVGAGSQSQPTPATNTHDVISPKITLPVLFSDVATGGTFSTAIYSLSDDDDIAGFADGTFRPNTAVSRAGFVQILYRAGGGFGSPAGIVGTGECTTIDPSAFSDVPNASPFCEAIKHLAQAGIVKGTGDGRFLPNATVSREEIAGFLYRAYSEDRTGSVATDAKFTPPSPFSDVTASNVFAGDIEYLASRKIIGGYSNGTYRPKANSTRAETAQLIYKSDF